MLSSLITAASVGAVISRRTGLSAGSSPHPDADPPTRRIKSTKPHAREGPPAFISIPVRLVVPGTIERTHMTAELEPANVNVRVKIAALWTWPRGHIASSVP